MGRGGKVGGRQNCKRRVRVRDNGSDDSDEDYMAEEDEEVELSEGLDEFCSDASEDSYGSFKRVEEEEEVGEMSRLKARRGSLGQNKIGVKISRKRKRVSYEEEEEEEEEEDMDDDDDDDDDVDNDDDEEFKPDEIDSVDEEEESLVENRNKKSSKVRRQAFRAKGPTRGKRRKKNFKYSKRPLKKDGRNNDGELVERKPVPRVRSTKNSGHRRRRLAAQSGSESLSSEPSDHEYTISEEERDQVREAGEFCKPAKCLRSSSSLKKIEDDRALVHNQRKPLGRKGKEKVEAPKNEFVKQICGICLSEEGKRTVRGILNCCTHYFCFACILEWSKVESRCPLCKQRFVTIRKPARSNAESDLRNAVIQVPQRDQVYQPSEEEMRIYLDPYEHVMCTECHQGGDDGLMLLCDLCDSPAHTYCVGLGREVPEGNWYCEGCRPVALASSNFQAENPLPEQRTATNGSSNRHPAVQTIRESVDFNYSTLLPQPPFTQGLAFGNSSSYTVGNVQTPSPFSGAGPSTLSGRRWIHRQIHHLLSSHIMARMAGRGDGISAANPTRDLLNLQGHDAREPTFQRERTPEIGTPWHTFLEERVPSNPSPLLPNRDPFSGRSSLLRRQTVPNSTTTVNDGSVRGTSWADYAGVNLVSGSEQLHSTRSSMGRDGGFPPCPVGEGSQFNAAKEQLQSMVRSHLQSFSRNIELGYSTFEDVTRRSTHTILAACGLGHSANDVYPVQPPSVCSHIEMMSGGQISLMKGCCSSCFESFVGNVVMRIMKMHLPQ